jgi:hypothetical protein
LILYLRPVASRKPLPPGCIPAPMLERKLIPYLGPVARRRNHFRQDVFLRQGWDGLQLRMDPGPDICHSAYLRMKKGKWVAHLRETGG